MPCRQLLMWVDLVDSRGQKVYGSFEIAFSDLCSVHLDYEQD